MQWQLYNPPLWKINQFKPSMSTHTPHINTQRVYFDNDLTLVR